MPLFGWPARENISAEGRAEWEMWLYEKSFA